MTKSKPQKTTPELERRWLVLQIDPDVQRYPKKYIEQAYLEQSGGPRLRITNGKVAELMEKSGRGKDRIEVEPPEQIGIDCARWLYDRLRYKLEKIRHMRDGWEIDYFQGPLAGLVLAEIEKPTMAELDAVTLPPWITQAVEVTNTLTNRMLAVIASEVGDEKLLRPVRDLLVPDVPRIVLTGGPCSGKSTVMTALREEFASVLQCVPETATIVIKQVGITPPAEDPMAMRRFQRTIYRVQLRFEKAANEQAHRDGRTALLLDRGTVDGAAYMGGGLGEMERAFRTTVTDEFARYRGIICLSVPPADVYAQMKSNNPARYEDFPEALAVDKRLHDVWSGHPDFVSVGNYATMDKKIAAVRETLQRMLSTP